MPLDDDTKNKINERFWDKVDIGEPDECWNWKAAIESSGYGSFGVGRITTYMICYR